MKGAFIFVGLGAGALALYFIDKNLNGGSLASALTPTHAIAEAIATAEGFYVPGSRPARNHNPGDMTEDLIGRATGRDGAFVVYETDADGWQNLYAQINLWFDGRSSHANADSTLADISGFYTADNQQSWLQTVAQKLGVSPDTRIGNL